VSSVPPLHEHPVSLIFIPGIVHRGGCLRQPVQKMFKGRPGHEGIWKKLNVQFESCVVHVQELARFCLISARPLESWPATGVAGIAQEPPSKPFFSSCFVDLPSNVTCVFVCCFLCCFAYLSASRVIYSISSQPLLKHKPGGPLIHLFFTILIYRHDSEAWKSISDPCAFVY
jgi:hypothetical protein